MYPVRGCISPERRALEQFEPLFAQAPNDPEIMRWVGNTYRHLGRWEEGLELLVKAADLSPRDPRLANTVLETYRLLHRYEEAERYFERLKFMGATERYDTRAWMAIESHFVPPSSPLADQSPAVCDQIRAALA